MTTLELAELAERMKTKTALLLEEMLVLQEHSDLRNKVLNRPTLFGTPQNLESMPMN
jgi:hypothetical protein